MTCKYNPSFFVMHLTVSLYIHACMQLLLIPAYTRLLFLQISMDRNALCFSIMHARVSRTYSAVIHLALPAHFYAALLLCEMKN